MSSLDNLTPEQREKYQQFVEFTQWKGDSDSPLALLNSTNWNVQTAIALHFDDTQAEPAQDSQSAAASSSSASASSFAQGIPTTTSLMEELNSQARDALKCTSFPFTQLIAPFPKTPNSLALVMKTLVTIQGETDPMKFISTLEEKMEAHTPVIASFTRDKQRVEDTQRLRQCQEDAYEQSLAIDRERERVAREEAQRAAEEEARELAARKERELAAEAKKRAKEEKKQKEQIWRAWKASQIGPEFDSATEKPARISIRMPSGERVVRKFSGNQTIDDIYAFVECYDLIKDGAVVPEPTEIPSPDYVHEYTFQLASTLPRQVIPADAGIKISDNKIIWPSASLVVEVDLSDDEEEED
ncbi:hypothetical protein DV495_003847 [Geotrichum candidum]|nr:hypothetical protein DV454_000485 [Geotrichum candidum]KAF5124723.1 hypothetical protein DV495_003847 [Geotrichum candidum]KAF7501048.1 hypothetical protein DV113_000891 [Geotrichum candidum]KAI8135685.1 hypothetical protein DUD61_000615 [Geotrichum candidum]KAI9212757.1 hypothetical protein DS838_002377 [Geotrichum bryndzae]